MERSERGVLILVENLPVPFDRRVWMEATTLSRAGYDVSVICPMGKGATLAQEDLDGVHIYRHAMPPEGSSLKGYLVEYSYALLHELCLARKVWKAHKFSIIHVCNPPDLLFLVALWFKWLHGVRVIFDHHDLSPELFEAKYQRQGIVYHVLCLAEKLTFRTANVVISTNESYREVALTRGKKHPDDVFIVRSGPKLDEFIPLVPDAAYCNGKDYLVGYVGVIGEQEGLDILLRAAYHIVHDLNVQNVHFLIIGDGPHRQVLEQMSEELGLQEYVEFTGRVPDIELRKRLSSCHVCVNPDPKTPFNDKSTMNKVLEYMALGKPIVQFDVTEGRRSAGDASLYAKPNDERDFAKQILKVLADPALQKRMGKIGQERMANLLEWRYQVPKLLAAYGAAGRRGPRVYENHTKTRKKLKKQLSSTNQGQTR